MQPTVSAMAINRGSRRARSESWLVRTATRIKRAISGTYILRVANSDDIRYGSLSSEGVEAVEATVLLKTGETIKVKAPDVERFLLENHDKVESRKRQRRGKPREKSSSNLSQQ